MCARLIAKGFSFSEFLFNIIAGDSRESTVLLPTKTAVETP